MPISANNTHITFNDGTTQNTAINASPGPTVTIFTANGTYSRPPTCKGIVVTLIGGGGGGVPGYNPYPGGAPSLGGYGGSGGGYAVKKYPISVLPTSIPVTVGAGGGPFGGSPAPGPWTGGTTQFRVDPSTILSAGGATPNNDPGGGSPVFDNSVVYGNGDRGQGTSIGFSATTGYGGGGGASFFGSGGGAGAGISVGVFTRSGRAYGSGGGGAPSAGNPFSGAPTVASGAGAPGIAIIEEFY